MLAAALAGCILFLVSPALPAGASGLLPPADPNNTPSPTFTACQGSPAAQAASATCTSQVIAAIDARHAAESLGPLVLPADFIQEPVTRQLMQVIGAERVSRDLSPPLGLVTGFNSVAQGGATRGVDPQLPDQMTSGAIWAGGMSTPLEADFGWMYDDGPGGQNIGCTPTVTKDCWGHRNIILGAEFEATPSGFYLGTAYAPGAQGGGSYAALLAAPTTRQTVATPYEEPDGHPLVPVATHLPPGMQVPGVHHGLSAAAAGWLRIGVFVAMVLVGVAIVGGRRRYKRWRYRRRHRPEPPIPAYQAKSPRVRPRPGPIVRPPDDGPGPWT